MKNKIPHTTQNIIELNLAVFLISTSGPLGRYIDLAPPVTIWLRALLACIIIGAYCRYRKISFKIDFKGDGISLLILGIFMGGHWITYFYALHYSNVAIGMLSLFTFPVITLFLEPLFLKAKISLTQVMLGLLIFLGIYLLVPDFSLKSSYTIGVLFGLFSAFLYAIRNLLIKKHVTKYDAGFLMWIQMFVITVVFIPVLLLFDFTVGKIQWLPIFALALFTTAIGHSLFVKSLRSFSVGTASILGGLQPVYGIILAAIFLKEYPTWHTLLGGGIILAAVVFESYRSVKD